MNVGLGLGLVKPKVGDIFGLGLVGWLEKVISMDAYMHM